MVNEAKAIPQVQRGRVLSALLWLQSVLFFKEKKRNIFMLVLSAVVVALVFVVKFFTVNLYVPLPERVPLLPSPHAQPVRRHLPRGRRHALLGHGQPPRVYSAQVTEFWEETGTLLFSDSSVTGDDFIGAFSIAVNDAGVAKRFEDYNTAIGVKDGAPLDIPGYWNVTYTQDAKTLLLSQQEALRALGEQNGYKSGFPVIISCACCHERP